MVSRSSFDNDHSPSPCGAVSAHSTLVFRRTEIDGPRSSESLFAMPRILPTSCLSSRIATGPGRTPLYISMKQAPAESFPIFRCVLTSTGFPGSHCRICAALSIMAFTCSAVTFGYENVSRPAESLKALKGFPMSTYLPGSKTISLLGVPNSVATVLMLRGRYTGGFLPNPYNRGICRMTPSAFGGILTKPTSRATCARRGKVPSITRLESKMERRTCGEGSIADDGCNESCHAMVIMVCICDCA